jgi:undecaprenyl pyrophosphate synthase
MMENGWTKRIKELEAEVAEVKASRETAWKRLDEEGQAVLKLSLELAEKKMDIAKLEAENTRLRMLRDAAESRAQGLEEENKRLMEQYNSLIFEVSYKFPGESRHDTAKRYIREREEHGIEIVAKQALKEASHES